jgi:2-methylisocitrate lyase-like PEP mutase family enzyme
MTRTDLHAAFAAMHDRSRLLILPNAWDAASARMAAHAGARAIATTSAGVANVLGYADGNHVPRDEAIDALARIVKSVAVPVSGDMEEGFGETPDAVADTAARVAATGAVGVNIEDGMKPAERLAANIAAVKARMSADNTLLWINARIDPYVRGHESPLKEAIRRAGLYLAAGADSIFVPGIIRPDEIATLTKAVNAPVNVLLRPGLPAPAALFDLGVARLSAGHMIYSAAMDFTLNAARSFLESQDYAPILDNALPADIYKGVLNS